MRIRGLGKKQSVGSTLHGSRQLTRHPLTALMLASGLLPGWAMANDITLYDGSGRVAGPGVTQTTIDVDGNVTDITTATVRGKAGFNSFGNFRVSEGNTVNLHVPGAASHLVNLVHDSRAEINGTLNGLKGGKVGGHILFADPHGFVVGSSGVVNVGSLTVTTPNMATMDELLRVATVDGHVNAEQANAYIDSLAAGQLPSVQAEEDGSNAIVIQGMVNTNGSINLHGASVLIEASAGLQAGTDIAQAVFASTVNTEGLAIGAGVARENGGILITAADQVEISGELAALMADDSGASVAIAANRAVTLSDDALIDTRGHAGEDGGDVIIEAPSLALNDNARIVTAASGAGQAGDITLNALSDLSCSFCDESAEPQTLDELKQGIESQANPWLSANLGKAEIIIGENAELDAGQVDDDSLAGDLNLNAFAINRQLAGYAEASARIEVDGSLTGREINLHADSRAEVARDVLGSLLNTDALKDDIAALKDLNNWGEEETWGNILDTLYEPIAAYENTDSRDAFLETPTNFTELTVLVPGLSAYIAKADSQVVIGSNASLMASADIHLQADAKRTVDSSTWQIPGLGSKIPFGFSAAYGQISGITAVDVLEGASLESGNDLSVLAHSQNTLSVLSAAENSVDGNGSALKTMGLGFGMAMSDTETRAVVEQGVLLDVARDVNVTALTEQSLKNTVSFKASGEGATGGPAIGLSILNSTTRAEFSADLAGARDLNLTAANLVHGQNLSVTVEAGASEPGYLDKLKTKAKEQVADPVTNYLGDAVKGLFGIEPKAPSDDTPATPTDSQFRLASALAISLADHRVEAVLGSADAAPALDLSGDLSVQALQRQSDMHTSAQSKVNASAKRDDGSVDGAAVSLSVAAVYSELDQTTHAIVGDGANVTAARIGVGAQNSQPLNLLGLDRWSSLDEVYANLKLLVEQKQGIVGKLATQYANSTGQADTLGMAGSLSILQNNTDASAWVGDNATLTATALDADSWTSNPLDILPVIDDDEARQGLLDLSWTWAAPVSVRAENQLEQLAVAGNFDALFGVTSDGGAVGAGVNVQITNNRAVAGIGAGGTVVSEALDVSALQDEMIIGLSPSAGKGASVAGNGSVVVSVVEGTVHASVHSSTDVTADRVNLDAEHRLGVWSAAGALAASENVGIGAGVAVNVVNTDVYALVGDNNLRASDKNSWRPESMAAGLVDASSGNWLVDELSLSAQSSGQSGAFSVAGALARSEEEQQQQDQVAAESGGADKGSQEKAGSLGEVIKTSLTNGLALLTGEVTAAKDKTVEQGEAALDKIGEYWGKLQGIFDGSGGGGDEGSSDPAEGFSLAAAAAGSVNVSAQKNRSHLGNIVLDPRSIDGGSQVNVLSLNQTHQFSGAGAGALTLSGGGDKSEFSAALSGAMAFNQLNNVTEASVVNVTLTDNDLLNVQAASGGDQIALGLGLSVATGGETNVAVALSGSAGVFGNQTRASVVDSVIQQRADNPGSIAVNAYDRSRNLLGGGAFAVSTDKGGSGGGSVVVAVMQNQLEAEWLGSTATDFASLDVKANSASRVLAGALGVAVSTGSESGAGAGSLFVVIMDNQVKARVDKTDNADSSLNGGNVTVSAASVAGLDALDSIFVHDASASGTLLNSGLDLDGTNTTAQIEVESQTNDELFAESDEGFDTDAAEGSSGADTTTRNLFDNGSIAGEAVLGIAGTLAATGGKTAVGGAFGVVYNGSDYAASIANTDIDLSGDLKVAARNETDVLAGAIGAAGAQNISVSGSATALIGRGTVSANLDMTDRTLVADDLVVEALKTGGFYSLAGSISASSNTVAVGGAFSINDMQQGSTALVQGGTYQLSGDATLSAAQQSRIITAALSAAVSASGVGVGAAMTYNRIADTTTAELLQAELTARDLTIAASQPNLGASIWSLAFNLSAGGGSAGVGAGVAVNLIDAERAARITGSTVNLSGDASLTSALDGEIWSIGIDAAGGGTAGVGGSFAFNNISGKDEVVISDSSLVATDSGQSLSLDASAGNGITIASLAGSVTGGGTAAVGLAASVNRIDADRTALINNSTVTDFASVELKSGVEQAIYSIAVAGGGAGTVAVNGATATNILDGTERAAVVGSTLDVGSLDLSTAEGKRTIWSLGLVLNGAGTAAVGAANVNNIILAKRIAEIDDAELTLNGTLSLASGGDALIRSAALGGGGAGTAAVGASVAVNVVDGEETARIKDASVSGATALTVEVTRGEVDIKTLAGNVQGGGTGAGAGAVAISTISQRRQALVENTALTLSAAAPARVEALTTARIDTLALSGAGAGTAAAVFSNTSNNIDAKTYAKVSGSSGSMDNLQIKATDNSQINSLSGGIAGAGVAAVGVATAVNRVANDIEASLTGARNGSGFTLNDLSVQARSDASIQTISVSGGFSGTAAVNGGVATSMLDTNTRALISDGARVVAQNNVAVVAYNRDLIDSYAGVVAGSGNAAVSGILTVNLVQSDTEAAIRGDSTRVTALALGTGVSVDNGLVTNAPNTQFWADEEAFNPVADLQTGSEVVRGVAVRATTLQQAGQMSVSAAVSLVPIGSASVGGVSNTSVLGGSTLATIDQALINQDNAGAATAQQVSVAAHAHSYSFGGVLNAALSLGAAAVAVTADAGVISRDVTAQISGATVTSRGQTRVKAGSTRSASNIVISASGAIVGVAGSASVLVLEGSTQALVDDASQLTVGSLAINADATNYLSASANTASGGAVGAGAGVGVGYNNSTVRAWLGGQPGSAEGRTRVTTAGAVSVEAASVTEAQALSVSISGGGTAAAGSVNVLIIENVTEAGVGVTDIGSSGNRAASLKVDAYDRLDVTSAAGSAAAGGVSLGASANVLVANNATRAMLLDSQAWVSGAVDVNALRESDVELYTVTGGVGGSAALGGSIGMIMLGSGSTQVDDSDAMDELNSGNNGTLSMVDGFTARETAETEYQTMELDQDTGEYRQVTRSNSADTDWLNQQGQIGSSADRLQAGDTYKHETLARVSNSQINTLGHFNINAEDRIYNRNLSGSAQASGTAAVGAAVSFTLSNARVAAELNGGSSQSALLDISGLARTLDGHDDAVEVEAYTGAAGFGVGLGAALAIGQMRNDISSSVSGAHSSTGAINLNASDLLDLDIDALGASAGAAAVGIVVATGARDSNVEVLVADDAALYASAINLTARGEGGIDVYGLAAAGGLFGAGTGVASVALESTRVEVLVGDDVILDGRTGGVSLSASVLPQLNAYALGASVAGGVAVGASYARAQTANTVTASLGGRADVRGTGGLRLKAELEYNRVGSEIDPDQANVRAESIAGSGGLFLSANATIAEAFNTASVSALTGTHLKLPSGRIEILADGRSHQYADALGVAVGGLAVGASVAKAESDSTTLARLGNFTNDRDGAALISDLLVNANAEDINQAKSVAGSGGVIAGNASVASTRTEGSATAQIGDSVQIAMRNLSLTAEYRAIYGTHANSVNAALAGASGAGGVNRVFANSLASIGQNSQLAAAQDLVVTANNNIFSRHLGEAASGAGGGVISGQAVYSDTLINSTAHVDVGNNVELLAGLNAADYSSRLLLRAFTRMQVTESVTLSTGGAIAGGGVRVDSEANLNNTVTIGTNSYLFSSGSLGAGTYSQAGMSLEALASTWGAAGVADARVDGDLNSNQLLSVGSNTLMEALGNITLTAGDDPEGLWQNTLQLNSVAHSSVRGIIAVPTVGADAHINNQANTVLASGSQALAARNVRAGSYSGLVSALADGEARGYQLGFIPVTSRNSNANISRNITATLNGTLLAGRYHELLIHIAANGTITQSAGLPVSAVRITNFNPRQFLDTFTDMDEVTRGVIEGTISGSNVGAIELGDMLAAGGTVTINADSLFGNGTLTANGGPRIEVINQSANYLLVGNALIPDQPGGRVFFTGAAARSQFNGQVNEVAADRRAEIRIDNSFGGNVGNVSYGPAIFLVGDILNQGGLIHISNAKGSLGQFGLTYGQQVLVEIPNGSMTVFQPNDYWSINSNPFSEWRSFAGVTGSANVALEYIASSVFGGGNSATLTGTMVYRGSFDSDSSGSSVVLFGGCLPASIGSALNCSETTARSFNGGAFQFRGIDNASSWMPIINYRALYKSAVNYEQGSIGSGGDGRRVVGGQVGIQARYIDINGTITSGMATNRSVTISADLDTWISQHGCSNGLCVEAVDIPTHLLTATSGQPIGAKYDFVNQRIQLDDVNASGGGFIYMRGGIISTNPAGRIEVNNGFGEVVIDNRSAQQLQLGDIDTGVGSVGIVQIVDTFKTTTGGQHLSTWYVHDQNNGLSVYDNRNGANSVLNAYRISSSMASSTSYNPLANLRFEWYQQATLSRVVNRDGDNFSVSNWVWNDVALNDPWFVSSGQVVTRAVDNVYEQTISGSLGSYYNQGVNYHGCEGGLGSSCNWGFTASGQYPEGHGRAGEYYAQWVYRMPQSASLRIDHSVKADNPFQIAFVGNSAGLIDAKTNNNLIIGGRLNNPGGLTRLTAAENIINGSDGSSFSRELQMTAGGFIGQDGRAVVAGLAGNGILQASSGAAGINLDLTSSALVRSINAGNGLGDVVVRVNGDLGAIAGLSSGTAHVLGRNLDLYATGGIGSDSTALRVIAREQATAAGGSTHGNLDAFAVRDVFINEIEGDAWVGQIVSETGDVSLRVENGSLYDAGQRLASDTLDETQRQQIWEKLKLTSEFGAEDNIQQGTVKPFEDQVVSQYREYWRLRELGSLQGDSFVLDADSLDFYRPLAELQAGHAGLSDTEVQAFAAERYNGHALFFEGVFGDNWAQQLDFQAPRSDFSYTASAAQIEALTRDAIWTEGELRYAIDSTALGSASSTPVGAADPNVSGRHVTLITGQNIGRLADSLLIDFAALRAGNLTPQEAAALAIANAPGDVELNRDEQGQLVSLLVNRTQPFYVAASERFDASSGGALYLQSAGDLNIGTVNSGGNARLAAASSILAANGAGSLIVGGDLTLQAGTGNLGTPDTDEMLSLDVAGRLLSASAGQHIGLRWLGDDFRIGRVFAVGDLRLDAPNGSLLGQFEGLAVTGQSIQLNARDAILGLDGAALVIDQSSADGELAATAGGDIRLSDTGALRAGVVSAGGSLYLNAQSTLSGRDLQAVGDLQLNSPEAIDLQRVSAGGNLLVSSLDSLRLREQALAGGNATWLGASLSMDADSLIQAGGLLAISTDGDMSLGQLYRTGLAEGNLFNLQAGGRIEGNGDGQVNLRAERTGSAIMLAESGIGSAARALLVDMPELTRTETRQGDIYLRNLSALSGTLMRAESGNIVLGNAGQSLQLGQLQALGNIRYQGGDLRVDQLDAGGWLNTDVSGDMHLGQAEVGEWAELHGSSTDAQLGWGDLNVGQALQVSGPGNWYGDRASAGQDVQFDVGSTDLGLLESRTGDLLLNASGNFAAAQLLSPQGLVQLQAGSVDVGQAEAAETLSVHSFSDLTLFSGHSGEDLTLTTEPGSFGSIRFGLLADPDAEGVLQPAHLYSDANILVQTDGDIFGGNAEAVGEVRMIGRNLFFGRAESLAGDVYLQAIGDAAQGHGNIIGLLVEAHRDVAILANGDLVMPTVRFGGSYSLKAGRDLTVGVGQDLDINGTAEAGRDLTFVVGGTVDLLGATAGRHLSIRSGRAINIDQDILAGGDILLEAADGDIRVGGNVLSTAIPYQGEVLNGSVQLLASGDISATDVGAAAGSILADGLSLDFANLQAADDVDLLARGSIRVGDSLSGGDQTWLADEDIGFNRLLAEGQALLDSLLDTRGHRAQADQGLEINAGWRDGVASPATIELQEAQAPTMQLRAGQTIRLWDASIGESADLQAQDIELYGLHSGSGLLNLRVTGLNNTGGAGDRFLTRLDATHVVVSDLDTVYTEFDTTALLVDFENATNVDYLFLTTPQAVVTVDNLSPGYRAEANVQVYEMDQTFWLYQNTLETYTNGYVLHRDFSHQIRVPNFAEGHQDGGVDYQAITAAAYSALLLTPDNTLLRLGELINQMGGYMPTPEQDIEEGEGGQSLNLDMQAFSENGGDKEQSWEI